MNFIESNGSKVAAVLCVASCFPVVATIYAMETQLGSDSDVNANVAKADSNAWLEITGTSPVISEKTDKVAKVSTALSDDVNKNVEKASKEYIKENTEVEEEVEVSAEEMEEVLFAEPTSFEATETVSATEESNIETFAEAAPVEVVEEAAPVEEVAAEPEFIEPVTEEAALEEAAPEEVVMSEEVTEEAVEVQSEAVEEAAAPVEEVAPVEEAAEEVGFIEVAAEPEVTEVVEEAPVYEEQVYEETYVAPEEYTEPVYEEPVVTSTSTGQDIANAALSLVGVTDGWQCTEVASYALALAGVEGVPVCWPDEYQYYGTVSYDAVIGSLAYYDNGGRGVDHIAVYVGDGECVHGNFDGQTIVYSENTYSGSPDYYVVFE